MNNLRTTALNLAALLEFWAAMLKREANSNNNKDCIMDLSCVIATLKEDTIPAFEKRIDELEADDFITKEKHNEEDI